MPGSEGLANMYQRPTKADKVKMAISKFKPFKYAGTDGIYHLLLEVGIKEFIPHVFKIFKKDKLLSSPESRNYRDKLGYNKQRFPRTKKLIICGLYLIKARMESTHPQA